MPADAILRALRPVMISVLMMALSTSVLAFSGKGRELYQRYCTQCHENEKGHWGSPESIRFTAYVMRTSGRELKKRVENGGMLCPSYLVILSEEDIENVVDYIKVLR